MLMTESEPFVNGLIHTLQTKSFLSQPSAIPAINPVQVQQAQPTQPAPLPSQSNGPAIVSSYRPGPPLNAPTGPAALQHPQPVPGPSSLRPMNGSGDVDMGGQGGGGSGSGKPKCKDYHGTFTH